MVIEGSGTFLCPFKLIFFHHQQEKPGSQFIRWWIGGQSAGSFGSCRSISPQEIFIIKFSKRKVIARNLSLLLIGCVLTIMSPVYADNIARSCQTKILCFRIFI